MIRDGKGSVQQFLYRRFRWLSIWECLDSPILFILRKLITKPIKLQQTECSSF